MLCANVHGMFEKSVAVAGYAVAGGRVEAAAAGIVLWERRSPAWARRHAMSPHGMQKRLLHRHFCLHLCSNRRRQGCWLLTCDSSICCVRALRATAGACGQALMRTGCAQCASTRCGFFLPHFATAVACALNAPDATCPVRRPGCAHGMEVGRRSSRGGGTSVRRAKACRRRITCSNDL